MRLLFIQGGTRVKIDENNEKYTDGNFNENVWKRYKNYCDELVVLLREDEKRYTSEFAKNKFNKFPSDIATLITLKDLNRPITRNINFLLKKNVDLIIEEEVRRSDKVIIRSILNHYTLTALKYCKKYKKDYLVEVAGFAFDGYWYHGDILGKLVAIPYELLVKKNMKKVPYAVYVTNEALQKRYPCFGKNLGCSDVEINDISDKFLAQRLEKYTNKNDRIILGTTGWVNLKLKGQHDVIKAIYLLRKNGIDNFEYQLVGAGDKTYLEKLIKKYNLEDCIKILGPKIHEDVFKWLDNIDIYIQPSYQEGLCRAIVEAMSRACPIIVSNAGGNYELANKKYIFKKGKVKEIVNILSNISYSDMISEAKRSFKLSKSYEKNYLNKKRDKFYTDFMKGI